MSLTVFQEAIINMDLAKQGRVKVVVGDCVSLPTSCWGAAYQSNLKDNHDIIFHFLHFCSYKLS